MGDLKASGENRRRQSEKEHPVMDKVSYRISVKSSWMSVNSFQDAHCFEKKVNLKKKQVLVRDITHSKNAEKRMQDKPTDESKLRRTKRRTG